MNLIYLYDDFLRVPAGIEGNPFYIFDDTLNEVDISRISQLPPETKITFDLQTIY